MTERINSAPEPEVLSEIMEALRFRSSIFFRSQLAAPWGFALDAEAASRFHISLNGSFFVGGDKNKETIEVGEMGIVILPNGKSHWIADRPGRTLVPSSQASEMCELHSTSDADGATNLVICGVTRFDTRLSHPLLEGLPTQIHFPNLPRESPVWQMVELLDSMAKRSPILGTPTLNRLAEALFLQLLEEFVYHGEETVGFVAALRDRRLRRALELIHQQPNHPWTIDALAQKTDLSRATLVRRFRDSVGMPPIEYLTRWRLLKAHQLLRSSDDSIEQIAGRVGFASGQTFTRAFKRNFGVTPSQLRA